MAPRRKRRRKRCRFCGQLFIPDPRLKGRQYSCAEPPCQGKRKEANQRRWLSRNPGYFGGRYPKLKVWLASHPGYLARYRLEHREKAEQDNAARKRRHLRAKVHRADMQVARSLEAPVSKALAPFLRTLPNADIQDSFLRKVVVVSLFSVTFLERARAEMQGSIVSAAALRYLPRHEPSHEAPAPAGSGPHGAPILQLDRPPPDP